MELLKVTNPSESSHGRWYGDACGTAFALELVGERWSLLIMRELMFGPRRFSDLRADLPGISAKTLTERLAGLEANGILSRIEIREPAPARLYELSAWGYSGETMIQELGRWAAASPLHDPTLPLSPASFMMSLRTMLDRNAADGLDIVAGFAVGKQAFTAHLADREMPVRRGSRGTVAIGFEAGEASALAGVFYGAIAAKDAGVTIIGDEASVERFIACFRHPEPAAS